MAVKREKVVQTAEKYVQRGKIEAAIREYRKLLAEFPDDATTLNRLGDLYARLERVDEAVKLFTQIAENYTEDGFFPKATAIYKKIIKLDPTRLEVYERLAELYHRQGLLNEARTQYQVLADYYVKHENTSSATAIYERMVEVDPDDPSLRARLAELYRNHQLTDKAMGQYRRIAELMLAHGAPEEAEQVFLRALDVDASDVSFITDAVLKLKEHDEVAAAARFLAAAVERNPEAERVAKMVGVEEEQPAAPEPEPEPEAVAPEPAAAEPEPGLEPVPQDPS
ncbi:MAG TPA: tetratricopeptide repeat protein, partial [Thermoanaerobaculia bacterium]|nr:tetratricopeptide repeat protein [Thermoanaerobaculia bacterium]